MPDELCGSLYAIPAWIECGGRSIASIIYTSPGVEVAKKWLMQCVSSRRGATNVFSVCTAFYQKILVKPLFTISRTRETFFSFVRPFLFYRCNVTIKKFAGGTPTPASLFRIDPFNQGLPVSALLVLFKILPVIA